MRKGHIFILSTFITLAGCAPMPNRLGSNINTSAPNLAVLGSPVASDEKAARVEQIRREKGTYWPGIKLSKVESTFVDGIYAYYDTRGKMFLVDETVSFAKSKSGTKPWIGLGGPNSTMPAQDQDAITRKTFQAWINDKAIFPMKFGNGNKRKFIYLTAPDCPVAKKFDEVLKSAAKDLDVTLYTHLVYIHDKPESHTVINNVLCSTNPQKEWFRMREGQSLQGHTCSTKPLYEDRTNYTTLKMLLSGQESKGTPTIIAEDGTIVDVRHITGNRSIEQAKKDLTKLFSSPENPNKKYF